MKYTRFSSSFVKSFSMWKCWRISSADLPLIYDAIFAQLGLREFAGHSRIC